MSPFLMGSPEGPIRVNNFKIFLILHVFFIFLFRLTMSDFALKIRDSVLLKFSGYNVIKTFRVININILDF
jgi:hypothetical protein